MKVFVISKWGGDHTEFFGVSHTAEGAIELIRETGRMSFGSPKELQKKRGNSDGEVYTYGGFDIWSLVVRK